VAAAVPGVPVYDGRVTTPADRYVVLYGDPGWRSSGDVAHTSNLVTFRFQLTYVTGGAQVSRKGCAWLADRCRGALVDVAPVVSGFLFGLVELESTQPIRPDFDAPTDVMFGVDSFVVLGAVA
jgi:hypothetical protein